MFITVQHLQSSCFGAPYLTRGWVCNLLVQSVVTLGSKSSRTHDHILLSHLRLPQPGGPGPSIYIPQKQGGSVMPPGTGFPFCRLLRLSGITMEVFLPASTRGVMRALSYLRLSLYGLGVDQQETSVLCLCVTMETRAFTSQCGFMFPDFGRHVAILSSQIIFGRHLVTSFFFFCVCANFKGSECGNVLLGNIISDILLLLIHPNCSTFLEEC
jgi:hypothetical protein